MKVFVALVLCVIAVNGQVTQSVFPSAVDIYKMKIFKYSMECLFERKLDLSKFGLQKDVKKAVEDLHKDEKACFAGCVFKKLGAMNDDGTFNEDKLFMGATAETLPVFKRTHDAAVKHCTDQVGKEDLCKFAACIVIQAPAYASSLNATSAI
ncbi:hypothetical protein TSAR_003826 [Trichomalopsis sarcophagae]|uniref:Uncharacterized protein n=1 Tax=Trichomalopsis sarcophagae TaxID=543379 RepID=A0A232FFH6_9HYME|nr:hypothetical protein TSAR_003826 [Trichomalopsis sarcophagae]